MRVRGLRGPVVWQAGGHEQGDDGGGEARSGLLSGLPWNLGAAIARQPLREMLVSIAHGEAAAALPMHHRDPWDRLLIAQARLEGLSVVSRDRVFGDNGVRVVR
jgi:hypothetical protein